MTDNSIDVQLDTSSLRVLHTWCLRREKCLSRLFWRNPATTDAHQLFPLRREAKGRRRPLQTLRMLAYGASGVDLARPDLPSRSKALYEYLLTGLSDEVCRNHSGIAQTKVKRSASVKNSTLVVATAYYTIQPDGVQ